MCLQSDEAEEAAIIEAEHAEEAEQRRLEKVVADGLREAREKKMLEAFPETLTSTSEEEGGLETPKNGSEGDSTPGPVSGAGSDSGVEAEGSNLRPALAGGTDRGVQEKS